jgi:hypothetical protein
VGTRPFSDASAWARAISNVFENDLLRNRAAHSIARFAVDDYSRLAYTEDLLDEKGPTAAGFWERAAKFFRRHSIKTIRRVLPDNGSCLSIAAVHRRARQEPHPAQVHRP